MKTSVDRVFRAAGCLSIVCVAVSAAYGGRHEIVAFAPLIFRWIAFAYGALICAAVAYYMVKYLSPGGIPQEVPYWLFPIYFPLFLLAGVLSIPYTAITTRYYKDKEKRFVRSMKSMNRVMEPHLFDQAIEAKRGTLIEEWFSVKGPVRYWWVDDDITAISPHACTDDWGKVVCSDGYEAFCSWWHQNYMNEGKPLLVSSSYVPEMPCP